MVGAGEPVGDHADGGCRLQTVGSHKGNSTSVCNLCLCGAAGGPGAGGAAGASPLPPATLGQLLQRLSQITIRGKYLPTSSGPSRERRSVEVRLME